jgi:hypothetical protein
MALSDSTLASGLEALVPVDDEADAIQAIVDAWDSYFAESSVNGVTATPGSYAAGLSAMQSAMVGISADGAGSASLVAGVTAFWTAIAGLATSIWITAPVVLVPPIVPPVGLAALQAALEAAFAANTSGSASLADSAATVALALHTNGGLGALVPGSVPPTPPAPLPIL